MRLVAVRRDKCARDGKVPRTSHKAKSLMKTPSERSIDQSCLKWTIDFSNMSLDIHPE